VKGRRRLEHFERSREATAQWRNGKQLRKWRVPMLEAAGIGGDGDRIRYRKKRGSEQTERLQWCTAAAGEVKRGHSV
jgi:hypothetical protein